MHIDAIFGAIGRWSVRLRWLVVLIWVIGAVVAVSQLPSLNSVTQSNNAKFLPASAPSQHAIDLATPFGNPNLVPIPVVAATTSGPLTPADITALNSLQQQFKTVPSVKRVQDAGRTANGQAVQLLALPRISIAGNEDYAKSVIERCRSTLSSG